jgi:hypothetical protein
MTKHAFWQALLFTIVVFGIGLILGFFLESSRSGKVQYSVLDSEINLLDEQVRDRVLADFDIDCKSAEESTFGFADKIFEEAKQLEQFDAATQFTRENFLILHRRYDLLRTMLWTEAIELKERCGNNFVTVVYLYSYASEDVDQRSKQTAYSRMLTDLKEKYASDVLLIPIAANMDLESVELIRRNYDIKQTPAIIVNEEKVLSGLITFDELEKEVFG